MRIPILGMVPPAGRSKYGAVPTTYAGRKYHSKKEANRARHLDILAKAGRVRNIRPQVRYPLVLNGVNLGTYVADFVFEEYTHGKWVEVVEDVKGALTPVYRIKKKLMKALHNITVQET